VPADLAGPRDRRRRRDAAARRSCPGRGLGPAFAVPEPPARDHGRARPEGSLPSPFMPRIITTIQIARPTAEVFRYVTTPATWPCGHPSSLRVEGATDHPLDVGEQVSEEFRVAGRHGRVVWNVRERQLNRRWVIQTGPARQGNAVITYTLNEQPGGTVFQ